MRREPSAEPSVPLILSFHQIHDRFSFGVTNYSPRRFFDLLSFIKGSGFSFVSVEDIMTRPGADRVAITFDDGYQHLTQIIPRAMDEFGVRPTIFVPTAYIGRGNAWDYSHRFHPLHHLNEGEIRQLVRTGVEIGSHGHSHLSLVGLDTEELERELVRSKQGLEELTGTSVHAIGYPFGRVDQQVRRAARDAGYRYGFTMAHPTTSDDAMATGRIAVYVFDTPLVVLRRLRRGPWAEIERVKAKIVNSLAGGTILLDRIKGRRAAGHR